MHLRELLESQRAAFRSKRVPTAAERVEKLEKLKAELMRYVDRLAAAEAADFGAHSRDEFLIAEIFPVVTGINDAIKRVPKWMSRSRRHVAAALQPASAYVIYQPLGVVGIITPWNYPVLLSLSPLTAALAAGNHAIIKLSEFAPATADVMRNMLRQVFPEDQVAVVLGDAAISTEFSQLPFDHLIFTGSTAVGRHVMRAAAQNLVPVTLELGGKSPVLVAPDAAIEQAAERVCWGKSLKAGQSCTAPDYILCPRSKVEKFVKGYKRHFGHMFPTLRYNPDYTSIINDRQLTRLRQLISDARSKGARLIELNPAAESLAETRKLPTTLVLDATPEMQILQEEIFGPILPILPYDRIEDAIDHINERPSPLALYLFSHDRKTQKYVMLNTISGGVAINDTMTHCGVHDIPFGGIGDSGMGHYHGREGLLALSKARAVLAKGRINAGRLMYPPYGGWIQRLILKLFLR